DLRQRTQALALRSAPAPPRERPVALSEQPAQAPRQLVRLGPFARDLGRDPDRGAGAAARTLAHLSRRRRAVTEALLEIGHVEQHEVAHRVLAGLREAVAVGLAQLAQLFDVVMRRCEVPLPNLALAVEAQVRVDLPELPVSQRLRDQRLVDRAVLVPAALEEVVDEAHRAEHEHVLRMVCAEQATGGLEDAPAEPE